MCGSFNEQVATFALEQINALPEKEEDRMVLVVGARVVGRLEDAGCAVGARFPVPSTVSGITSAVHDLLLKVEELRFQKGIDQFLLVHHSPSAPAGSCPGKFQLLPIALASLRNLATTSWDSRSFPPFPFVF